MEKILEIKDLAFSYVDQPVLNNINLTLEDKKALCIVGENGSGKSTLVKIILGELIPQRGSVKVLGQNPAQIKNFNEIGYVPQVNAVDQIAFPITSEEMLVMMTYDQMGPIKVPRKKHYERAHAKLKEFNLYDYRKTPFKELSGGLQQRVMIARAMMNNPRFLILDEPTAGVDQESKADFFELLNQLKAEKDISYLLITHELELVKEELNLDQISRIQEGEIIDVSF